MGRKRKRWSYSTGRYGSTVRIYEPRPGAPLRWDYRDEDQVRHRPEVDPPVVVRPAENEPVDAVLARRAEDLCEQKAAELRLRPLREGTAPADWELGQLYDLYFDPRRNALPPSESARKHHRLARALWEGNLGTDRTWNTIVPADVWGVLLGLKAEGKVATAEKSLTTLRTVYRWLQQKMRIRGLEDPTLGLEVRDLREGHEPRRPRYDRDERAAMRKVWTLADPRFRLFMSILTGSGARAIQARSAMRSGVDAPLEVGPRKPPPHGWLLMAGVKGQAHMLTYLTEHQRRELDAALAGYLAPWEAAYQAGELEDYPLIPSGRLDQEPGLKLAPISDTALRKMLKRAEKQAGVKRIPYRGFHGYRRAWVDIVDEKAGIDTATHAGGWSSRDQVEGTYVSPRRYEHLERARKVMEEEGHDDAERPE